MKIHIQSKKYVDRSECGLSAVARLDVQSYCYFLHTHTPEGLKKIPCCSECWEKHLIYLKNEIQILEKQIHLLTKNTENL